MTRYSYFTFVWSNINWQFVESVFSLILKCIYFTVVNTWPWVFERRVVFCVTISTGRYTGQFLSFNPWYVSLMMLCVCLYSSTCWLLLTARRLWHTWDVRINDLLLWVLLGASAKFLHLHFWTYDISPPKT